ncbi:MAG: DNA-directed RNA polymerase subunit alpha, partial [bacterium]|nr:DNA-directed RNA polymerase subunit alpha [bacterium]
IRIIPEEERPEYGRFVIEPLEQGYGQTIGNSLRRALLSSLSGAAITQVNIRGAAHQFTSLEGVSEDVVMMILNLKKIHVRLDGKEKGIATLKVKGLREVKASDIELPAGATIANPEQPITTIAKGVSLEMEIVIEQGKGYSSADERPSEEIGVIPVDALFSPVVRVNYTVEATRVGRITNFDKLTIDITTNGTRTPSECLVQAASVLVDHFTLFVHPEKTVGTTAKVDRKAEAAKRQLVDELDLPIRIVNSLKAAGIETIGDLAGYSRGSLRRVRNLGGKSIDAVEKTLVEKGLNLSTEEK